MDKLFSDDAWEEFMYWIKENCKTADKVSPDANSVTRCGKLPLYRK